MIRFKQYLKRKFELTFREQSRPRKPLGKARVDYVLEMLKEGPLSLGGVFW